ncbi:MAG TPA: hypothetical protein VLD67_03735 [Vicinamibacterales bacterium]|nr:hypothetical protein [Vicinamibacterales bacterium]
MFALKPLHKDAIDTALLKAERYRLLNEPGEAESICLDVLEIEPGNQAARIALLLSLTDQFADDGHAYHRAREVLSGVTGEYERAYYAGIIAERRAKAQLARAGGATSGAFDWLREAMTSYERAEAIRPPGNDDALLRWNACVRLLARNPRLRPSAEERTEIDMLE